MTKKYFVSYAYEKGFGQIEITCDREVKTYNEIDEFRNTIKKNKKEIGEPIILFFKEIK